jgi:hypothetical protein
MYKLDTHLVHGLSCWVLREPSILSGMSNLVCQPVDCPPCPRSHSVKVKAVTVDLAHRIVQWQRRPYMNSPPLSTPGIVVREKFLNGSVVFTEPK